MFENSKIAIVGSGSWATALAKILLNNVGSINWYVRSHETIQFMVRHKHNPNYLCDVLFDTDRIRFSNDINETVRDADIIILVVPSAFLKETMASLTVDISKRFVISAIKGIVPPTTKLLESLSMRTLVFRSIRSG